MKKTNRFLLFVAGGALLGLAALALAFGAPSGYAQQDVPPMFVPTPPPTVEPLPPQPGQILSGVIDGLPSGMMLVEGDILIQTTDFARRYALPQPDGANAPQGTYEVNTWPNGLVPYEFDANVTAA